MGGSIGLGLPLAHRRPPVGLSRPQRSCCLEGGRQRHGTRCRPSGPRRRESLDVTHGGLRPNRTYAILRHELSGGPRAGTPGPKAADMLDIGRPDLDWVALGGAAMGVPASRATTAEEFNKQFAAGPRGARPLPGGGGAMKKEIVRVGVERPNSEPVRWPPSSATWSSWPARPAGTRPTGEVGKGRPRADPQHPSSAFKGDPGRRGHLARQTWLRRDDAPDARPGTWPPYNEEVRPSTSRPTSRAAHHRDGGPRSTSPELLIEITVIACHPPTDPLGLAGRASSRGPRAAGPTSTSPATATSPPPAPEACRRRARRGAPPSSHQQRAERGHPGIGQRGRVPSPGPRSASGVVSWKRGVANRSRRGSDRRPSATSQDRGARAK